MEDYQGLMSAFYVMKGQQQEVVKAQDSEFQVRYDQELVDEQQKQLMRQFNLKRQKIVSKALSDRNDEGDFDEQSDEQQLVRSEKTLPDLDRIMNQKVQPDKMLVENIRIERQFLAKQQEPLQLQFKVATEFQMDDMFLAVFSQ